MKHSNRFLCVMVGAVSLFSSAAYALVVGSNSTMSLEPKVTFPAADNNNQITGLAVMENGFTLENGSTECSFDPVFSIVGGVDLNGGTLTLERDLLYTYVTTMTSAGRIEGQGNSIKASNTLAQLGTSASSDVFYFNNLGFIFSANLSVQSPLTFEGTCTIDMRGYVLDFDATGSILIAANANLTICNAIIKGIEATSIQCLAASSVLKLQNVKWMQCNESYSFSNGALIIEDDVMMCGAKKFVYASSQTSTVLADSMLFLDQGFTFSYDPASGAQNLLAFVDDSAILQMSYATLHATTGGLQLTDGTLRVVKDSVIASEVLDESQGNVDAGITFGNDDASHDFICKIVGSKLQLSQGSLRYRNVNAASLALTDMMSSLFISANAKLALYQSMNLGMGIATFGDGARLAKVSSDVTLAGSIVPLGVYYTTGV